MNLENKIKNNSTIIEDEVNADALNSPTETNEDLSWGNVLTKAITNTPASGQQALKDLVTPFLSPIDTAKSLGNLALGTAQKIIPGEQESEKYADAVGKFVMDRYGSMDNFKRTLSRDPVGVLADTSAVFTGGGMIAAKVPSLIAKATKTAPGQISQSISRGGEALANIGQKIDPLMLTAKTLKKVAPISMAGKLTSEILGTTTGVGGDAIREAYKAGSSGGDASRAFRENISGKVPMTDVLDDAQRAVNKMYKNRSEDYQKINKVKESKKILDFQPINDILRKQADIGSFKGKTISKSTDGVYQEIANIVDEWRVADPSQFHTIEGLDALKKSIGDVMMNQDVTTPSYKVAKSVYDQVREQIIKQDPEYGKIMRAYENSSGDLADLQKTLSMSGKATTDTKLRKLQSVMNNSVNTNWGQRRKLVEKLDEVNEGNILPKLAGQALNAPMPRGIQRAFQGLNALSVLKPVGMAGTALQLGTAPLRMAFSSPRLIGEGAYKLGQGANIVKNLPKNIASSNIGRRIAEIPQAQRASRLVNNLLNNIPRNTSPSVQQIGRLQEELEKMGYE